MENLPKLKEVLDAIEKEIRAKGWALRPFLKKNRLSESTWHRWRGAGQGGTSPKYEDLRRMLMAAKNVKPREDR